MADYVCVSSTPVPDSLSVMPAAYAENWTSAAFSKIQHLHCQPWLTSLPRTPATPTPVETSRCATPRRTSWPAPASPDTWAHPRIADSAPTTHSVPPTLSAKGEAKRNQTGKVKRKYDILHVQGQVQRSLS